MLNPVLNPDRAVRSLNRGSVLPMLFGYQLLVLLKGVGALVGRSAARGQRFYDGLAEGVGCNFDEVQVALCHYPFHTANHQTPLKTEKTFFCLKICDC